MNLSGALDAITKPFRKPEGYVSAMEEKAAAAKAAAPAPAPVAAGVPRLGGVNMDAMKRREAAAGLKDGGPVHGPGTGTSDSIPAKLSAGEFVLPADTVKKIGVDTLNALVAATHKPVKAGVPKARGMADGGMVAPPAPTPAPMSVTNPGAVVPGAAPVAAPVAPPGQQFQQELDQRNLATTASSIVASPERDKARAAMGVQPPAAPPPAAVPPAPPPVPPEDTPPAQRIELGVSRLRTGAPRGYANGGLVDDEKNRPPITSATEAVLRQSSDDARAAAARGNYGEAMGNAARGIAGAIPAMAVDLAAPLAPVARGVGDFAATVATGQPMQPPAVQPVAAGVPRPAPARPAAAMGGPAAPGPNPQDQRMAAQSAGVPVGSAPEVTRMTSPGNAPVFTNVPGTTVQSMQSGGVPSAQNMGAVQALSDRSRVESLVATYGPEAAKALLNGGATARGVPGAGGPFGGNQPLMAGGNLPAGAGMLIAPDTGGVGVLDKGYQAQRSAEMTVAPGGPRAVADMAKLGVQTRAAAAEGDANRASAEQRTATTEAGATQREGARLGVQTAMDTRKMAMAEAESRQKLGIGKLQQDQAQKVAALQAKFMDPNTSEKERATLQQQLLVLTGKDKDNPNRFTVVPGGQQIIDGQVVTVPARVLDNQSGKFVDQQGGQGPATAAVAPPAAVAMLKQKPELAAQFDAKYGPGAAVRAMAQR